MHVNEHHGYSQKLSQKVTEQPIFIKSVGDLLSPSVSKQGTNKFHLRTKFDKKLTRAGQQMISLLH